MPSNISFRTQNMLYNQMISQEIELNVINNQAISQNLANKVAQNQTQLFSQEDVLEFEGPNDEIIDQELILQATEKMHAKNKTNLQSALVEIEDPQSDDEIGQDKIFSLQLKNSLEVCSEYKEFKDPSEEDGSKNTFVNLDSLEKKAETTKDLRLEAFLLFKSDLLTKNQYNDIKVNSFEATSYKKSNLIKTTPMLSEEALKAPSLNSNSTLDASFVHYLAKSNQTITSSEYNMLKQLEKARSQNLFHTDLIKPIQFQAQNLMA